MNVSVTPFPSYAFVTYRATKFTLTIVKKVGRFQPFLLATRALRVSRVIALLFLGPRQ